MTDMGPCGKEHQDVKNACASGPGWHREYAENPTAEDVERLLEAKPDAVVCQGKSGGAQIYDVEGVDPAPDPAPGPSVG